MLNNLLQKRQQLMQQTQQTENQFQKQLNQDEQNWMNVGAAAGGLVSDALAKRNDGINDNGTIGITTDEAQGLTHSIPDYSNFQEGVISIGINGMDKVLDNYPTITSAFKKIYRGG